MTFYHLPPSSFWEFRRNRNMNYINSVQPNTKPILAAKICSIRSYPNLNYPNSYSCDFNNYVVQPNSSQPHPQGLINYRITMHMRALLHAHTHAGYNRLNKDISIILSRFMMLLLDFTLFFFFNFFFKDCGWRKNQSGC